MHKEIHVKCSCGWIIELSEIQFDDFDCGMMGFMYCPDCKAVLFPGHHRKDTKIQQTVIEVEGKDRGWS